MKIGIYSGTFDPVHAGHIAFCREALRECGLDKIVLLPEAEPREKVSVSPLAERMALLHEATRDMAALDILQLGSKQFTVAGTLPELRRRFKNAELTLLVGSDVVPTFAHRWPDVDVLLKNVSLAIALRGDDNAEVARATLQQLEHDYNLTIRYSIVQSPHPHLSSTLIRTQAYAA